MKIIVPTTLVVTMAERLSSSNDQLSMPHTHTESSDEAQPISVESAWIDGRWLRQLAVR